VYPFQSELISYSVDWSTLQENHEINWQIVIVSSITNIILMIANVNWVSDNMDWAALPENHAMNWASIIVNWVTNIWLIWLIGTIAVFLIHFNMLIYFGNLIP
jgi:hypothetical protein